VNPTDKNRHIGPDEMEDAEVSPGSLAGSSRATPDSSKGGPHAPSTQNLRDAGSRGQRDLDDRSRRSKRKPDK
jgi:hypothetical protein